MISKKFLTINDVINTIFKTIAIRFYTQIHSQTPVYHFSKEELIKHFLERRLNISIVENYPNQ